MFVYQYPTIFEGNVCKYANNKDNILISVTD